MQTPPPIPERQSPDWIHRNWIWFIPLCCLVVLTCIGGTIVLVTTVMKSSDAYSGAVARARSNPAVMAALGTPIKDGFFFEGHISEENSSGRADLVIPISGPKAAASLYVSATRSSGEWHFDALTVQINGTKQRIDITETNLLPVTADAPGSRSAEER